MTVSSYIGISELSEVRGEVISQSLPSTWECHSTDEEDEQYQVGEAGSEVHHLQTQKWIQTGYVSLRTHSLNEWIQYLSDFLVIWEQWKPNTNI